jgi:hypothetical protein
MLDNSESEETLSSDNEYVLENDFELDDESEIKEAEKADSNDTIRPENLDNEDSGNSASGSDKPYYGFSDSDKEAKSRSLRLQMTMIWYTIR